MREASILSCQENHWTVRGHVHTLPPSPSHPSSAVRTGSLLSSSYRVKRVLTGHNKKQEAQESRRHLQLPWQDTLKRHFGAAQGKATASNRSPEEGQDYSQVTPVSHSRVLPNANSGSVTHILTSCNAQTHGSPAALLSPQQTGSWYHHHQNTCENLHTSRWNAVLGESR